MKLFIITVKQKLCINQDFNHGYGVAITCRVLLYWILKEQLQKLFH